MISVLSFVTTIVFWPGIASAATTPRWAILSVATFSGLFFINIKPTLSHVFLGAILLWGMITLSWATVPYDFALIYFRLLIVAGLFLIGAEMPSLRPILIGCSIGLAVNGAIAYAQTRGWEGVSQIVKPGGLFLNKNMGAEFAAMILVGIFYERLWWCMPLVLPSFMMQNSRTASASVIVISVVWLMQRHLKALVVLGSIAAAATVFYYLIFFDGPVAERVYIWIDTLRGYSWWGQGIGQFYSTYPLYASHIDTIVQRPEHAHNDFLELGYELGIAVCFVIGFIVATWRGQQATERAVLLAVGVQACFSFPLYMPTTAAIFAVVAGRLAGSGPSLQSDLARSRAALDNCMEFLSDLLNRKKAIRDGRQDIPA